MVLDMTVLLEIAARFFYFSSFEGGFLARLLILQVARFDLMFKQKIFQRPWCATACAVFVTILVLVFASVIFAPTLSERHLPAQALPAINYDESLSYNDYVRQVRGLIASRNTRASESSEGRTVLDEVAPKEWPLKAGCDQPTKGVLLIHGLSDGPYAVSDLGDSFSQGCMLVRSVLLPGHSTVPGDLAPISYQDWIDASSWAMESFAGRVDKLIVVGFSTGATLAIDYAIRKKKDETNQIPLIKAGDSRSFNGKSSQVVGLVLLSPAIAIKTSAAFLTRWVDKLGAAIYEPWRWVAVREDLDYAKYESFHMNAAAQIYMLTKKLGSTLDMKRSVPVPVFVVASEQDTTIDTEETVRFFHDQTDSDSRMLLYTSKNLKTEDSRIEVRSSADLDKRILSQSHISIPFSPDNPHYGENGSYVNCLHYSDNPQLSSCLDRGDLDVLQGEITKENKAEGTLRRISWNPDYAYMMNQIDQFISAL